MSDTARSPACGRPALAALGAQLLSPSSSPSPPRLLAAPWSTADSRHPSGAECYSLSGLRGRGPPSLWEWGALGPTCPHSHFCRSCPSSLLVQARWFSLQAIKVVM